MQQQSDNNFQGNAVNVNPLDYPSVLCPDCGCQTFVPAMIFKRIPGVVLGTGGREEQMAVKVFICSKCGALSPMDRELIGEDNASGTEGKQTGDYTTTTSLII